MKKVIFLYIMSAFCLVAIAQQKQNVIKPIGKEAFIVDSILSMKGTTIEYLLSGTEFDIAKEKVAYIEHSILGRIEISEDKPNNITTIPEPEFNGDVFICDFEKSTYTKAEKAIGQVKTKDQLWGPEKKLYVKPDKSTVRIKTGRLQLLVRVPNANDDPYAFVKISQFSTGKTRKLSLARQNEISGKITYGGRNNQDKPFEAKKYGKSSYIIIATINEPGEYCLTISNPNKIDGKLSISCFGVD